MRPVIAVFGATGAQGGGLLRALLRDPAQRFTVPALTRQPGAEVVVADLDRHGMLTEALEGVHGLFGVTDFWEHFNPERELRQAAQLAHAAGRAGVRRIIWSTQEHTRAAPGAWRVPQMDAKGQADAFFRDLPTTYVLSSSTGTTSSSWACTHGASPMAACTGTCPWAPRDCAASPRKTSVPAWPRCFGRAPPAWASASAWPPRS